MIHIALLIIASMVILSFGLIALILAASAASVAWEASTRMFGEIVRYTGGMAVVVFDRQARLGLRLFGLLQTVFIIYIVALLISRVVA